MPSHYDHKIMFVHMFVKHEPQPRVNRAPPFVNNGLPITRPNYTETEGVR